jgi:hypothetical protein
LLLHSPCQIGGGQLKFEMRDSSFVFFAPSRSPVCVHETDSTWDLESQFRRARLLGCSEGLFCATAVMLLLLVLPTVVARNRPRRPDYYSTRTRSQPAQSIRHHAVDMCCIQISLPQGSDSRGQGVHSSGTSQTNKTTMPYESFFSYSSETSRFSLNAA